jgi:hypothetical protein
LFCLAFCHWPALLRPCQYPGRRVDAQLGNQGTGQDLGLLHASLLIGKESGAGGPPFKGAQIMQRVVGWHVNWHKARVSPALHDQELASIFLPTPGPAIGAQRGPVDGSGQLICHQKVADTLYVKGDSDGGARRSARVGSQQNPGKQGTGMVVDGVARLNGHVFNLEAKIGQLAPG